MNIDGLREVTVNVPVPDGYIIPTGSTTVTSNGTHNVHQYDSVVVNVPVPSGYIIPNGTHTIKENGVHDITAFKAVSVEVPSTLGVIKTEEELTNTINTAQYGTFIKYTGPSTSDFNTGDVLFVDVMDV
jgi:hypothetical protein